LDVVSDPALFVQDAKSSLAVARGIAAELDVDASQVHVVLSLNTRRLSKASNLRGDKFSGSVMVSYTITVPPADGAINDDLVVAAISQKMTAVVNDPVVRKSFGQHINEQFEAADHSVTVTAAIAPTVESQIITTTITTTLPTTSTVVTTTATIMPTEPDSSFAHKHVVLGSLHVLGMLAILFV